MAAATSLENDLITRLTITATCVLLPALATADMHFLVVEGLPGDPVYADQFASQVTAIRAAAQSVTEADHVHVLRGADASRDAVLERLQSIASVMQADDRFAFILIGHGSYDDFEYKFNIPGPDLTGADIANALETLPSQNQLLVNTSSASGALADLVAADNRIVVLATRSGAERHATRFGTYFADALADTSADSDKNNMVSVEEAFLFATRQVSDYFERNNQLATEHAKLSGDRAGRLALARLGGSRPAVVDTELAELITNRDVLNAEIETLRLRRDDMPAADYQAALLEKMLELARIEDAIELRQEEIDAND
jgi:hypothetical protein